jgi:hypothetical protein
VYCRASEGCIAYWTITNIFEAGFDLWKMQHNCQSSAVSHCKCFLKQDVALIVFNAAFSRFAFAAMLFCCFRWSFKMFWLGP